MECTSINIKEKRQTTAIPTPEHEHTHDNIVLHTVHHILMMYYIIP